MAHYEMNINLNVNLGHAVAKRVSRVIEAMASGRAGRGQTPSAHVLSGHELKFCIDAPLEIPMAECWRLHAVVGDLLATIMDTDAGEIAHISRLHRVFGPDVQAA